jgi:hypothetical protein
MRRWLAIVLVGCGGNEQPPAAPVDTGVEVADAVVDVAPDAEPEPLGTGRISITQLKTSATMLSAQTAAAFMRNIPTTMPATCTRGSIGPCDYIACDPAPAPEAPSYASAGTITLEGGLLISPLTVGKTGETYGHAAMNEPYFKGGDDIRVKASGDVVPAFELSVTTPEDLIVTKPSCTDTCGELDRGRDYEVVWTPLRYGTVDVSILTNKPSIGYAALYCSAPATAGRLVIPADAVAKLRSDGTANAINILPRSTETMTVSGWIISLVTTANGVYAPITVK